MLIRKLRDAELGRSCGIGLQSLYPWEGTVQTPFGAAWGRVGAGETSHRHGHHEAETFFIVEGQGTVEVDGETRAVEAGDVLYFPPFTRHSLHNEPGRPPLLFLTVYWEDMALARQRAEEVAGSELAGVDGTVPVVIFTAPPTPNGDLHLGHLSGPYLAADVHRRFLRQCGIPAFFISGSDDFQSYVVPKAAARGESPAETARHFSREMLATLDRFGARPDQYTVPHDLPGYREEVQEYFLDLYRRGLLVRKTTPCLYCDLCDRYLFEPFVSGRCPHCGEGCGGNACEQCGRPNAGVDMLEPACGGCGERPGTREIERLFLPLSAYEELIRDSLSSAHLGPHLGRMVREMLGDGLPDLPVSQPCEWGIPVPVEGFEGQVIWAWFEMAVGFRIGLRELGRKLGWPLSPTSPETGLPAVDTRVVHFFGFDNGQYFCLLFRALYAADPYGWKPLETLVCNELYRLEGAKFSTSRNHLIWGRDFLRTVPVDVARFYLCYDRPETAQTDFRRREFEEVVARELRGQWEPWLLELGQRVRSRFGGVAPEPGFWMDEHQEFFRLVTEALRDVGRSLAARSFSPQRATRRLCELVREARRFAAGQEHWSAGPDGRSQERTAIALELAAARALATGAAPILPDFAARLWSELGLPGAPQNWPDPPAWVPSGTRVELSGPYFPPVTGGAMPVLPGAAVFSEEERISV